MPGKASERVPAPAHTAENTSQISFTVPRSVSFLVDVVKVLAARNTGQNRVLLLEQRHQRLKSGTEEVVMAIPKNQLTYKLGLPE